MDFIYRVPNLLSLEFCKDLIEKFENSKFKTKGASYVEKNGVVEITNDTNSKISTDISIYPTFADVAEKEGEPDWFDFIKYINEKLEKGLDAYMLEHPALENIQQFDLEAYNIQRYLPGEGFYNWHCENSGYKLGGDRVLAWMFYLNDVDDGGTEFKAQNHTEKAEAGKFLIWPAYWTHMHRGEISQTKTKYIVTGWFRHINN
jgi:hypothetical protein